MNDLDILHAYSEEDRDTVPADAVEVVITHSMVGIPQAMWERFPNLRLVANLGVGLDRIDLDQARKRGVAVTYTPDHLTSDVADLAIGFIVALSRKIVEADAFLRTGGWANSPFPLATSVTGRRLGILGLGRIGNAISERASSLRMEIGYFGRKPQAASCHAYFDTALRLAEWADVLVVALPGGPETERIISADVLAALGAGGLIVNVARQSVIDEPALVNALRNGSIGGAGLEIFDKDSVLPSQLAGIPNVLITPHIGSATLQTRTAMADSVYANVRAMLANAPLTDCAN